VVDRVRLEFCEAHDHTARVLRVGDDQIIGNGRDVHGAESIPTGEGAHGGWGAARSTTDC
jgi:hypothetical protein